MREEKKQHFELSIEFDKIKEQLAELQKKLKQPPKKIIKLIDDSDDEGSEIDVIDNKIVMNL